MARLKCICGNTLTNGSYPSRHHGDIVTQNVMENYEIAGSLVGVPTIDVWECPECKALALFLPRKHEANWYTPASPIQETLLDKVV